MIAQGKFSVLHVLLPIALIACALFCIVFSPIVCFADTALNLRIGTYAVTGDDYIVWNAVTGATRYDVYVNGQSAASFSNAEEVRLDNLVFAAGDYVISVSAKNDAGEIASESVNYRKTAQLAAPDEFSFSDKMLSWLAVPDADYYSVTVNHVSVGTTENSWFDLSNRLYVTGVFTAEVIAYSNFEYFLPSDVATFTFTYTAPPLPIWHIELACIFDTVIASWPIAGEMPDGFNVKLYYGEELIQSYFITTNNTEIGPYLVENGTYTISVAVVEDGLASSDFSKSFVYENGEVTTL